MKRQVRHRFTRSRPQLLDLACALDAPRLSWSDYMLAFEPALHITDLTQSVSTHIVVLESFDHAWDGLASLHLVDVWEAGRRGGGVLTFTSLDYKANLSC